MALVKSPKGFTGIPVLPKSISSIVVSVGGLALFLIFASWLLISYPVGPTVHGYLFTGSGSSPLLGPNNNSKNESVILLPRDSPPDMDDKIPSSGSVFSNFSSSEEITQPILPGLFNGSQSVEGGEMGVETEVNDKTPDSASNKTEEISLPYPPLSIGEGETGVETGASDKTPDSSSNKTQEISMPSPPLSQNPSKTDSGGCDLYHGNWFFDSSGPLYTNNTCPIITQMQNCQGNGRPDKDYESWRWKPSQCVLPRFDAKKFLELMRGKTLAFIGDSVARNQMESMLCLLWQVEVPKNRGNRHMQRWFFKSTSVMIVRIWSSWLVHQTSDPFDFAPKGVSKLHLDAPDEGFMEFLPKFDVVVLSSGHWFAKQSVYILNNEIVGGQLWWPDKSRPMKVNNIEAFGISTETILTAISTYPNYTGLTIVRSFSPDHYEGGAWNTGGSCTGKVKPATELVENGFTNIMHEKQVTGFNRAVQKSNNGSKLRLMDITEAFGYRHDGHPGPFRNPDPNKKTKRGPHGEPPPQDCLHWCMPGPVDTWNEIVLEIIHREYGDSETSPA
ncbi:PMR5 N-terminal domain [Macleaya cordata]|uniref:PMR5 N-terminal domain n=1 Tax=Macleaya cordata TaxID=56857 RepID=A0A200PZX2_MACCD|nr:PMR5 N-terminal domain [Macleaya cordata]